MDERETGRPSRTAIDRIAGPRQSRTLQLALAGAQRTADFLARNPAVLDQWQRTADFLARHPAALELARNPAVLELARNPAVLERATRTADLLTRDAAVLDQMLRTS